MPFADAIALFDYWAKFPPVHLMVGKYLGFDEASGSRGSSISPEQQNPVEVATAMRMITGSSRAQKVSKAPPEVRAKFEALKEQAKKMSKK